MTQRGRKITRSALLTTVGLLGLLAQSIASIRYHERPDSALVLAFLALIGIPVYGWADKASQSDSKARKSGRHVDDD